MKNLFALALFAYAVSVSANASATAVLTFANDVDLEDEGVGDSVGDTADYTDVATSVTGTLTTRGFTDQNGDSAPSASLNPNSGTLGVNSGSGSGSSFDENESWTFDWNVDSEFVGINFGSFTTSGSETFTLTVPDWVGLVGVNPAIGAVTFDGPSGTFTFSDKDASDIFDLNDISGGTTLSIAAGSDITLAYSPEGADGTAVLESISFNFPTAIPEPSALAILFVGSGLVLLRRSRQ